MDCKHTGEETCRVYPRGIKAGGCSVPDCFEKHQNSEADVRLNDLLNAACQLLAETLDCPYAFKDYAATDNCGEDCQISAEESVPCWIIYFKNKGI